MTGGRWVVQVLTADGIRYWAYTTGPHRTHGSLTKVPDGAERIHDRDEAERIAEAVRKGATSAQSKVTIEAAP